MNTRIFLHEKIPVFTKMPKFDYRTFATRLERKLLQREEIYAPLRVGRFTVSQIADRGEATARDVEICLVWRDRQFCFAGQILVQSSPRQVKTALLELKDGFSETRSEGCDPLLLLPYISSSVEALARETGISVLDLNGNYVLQTDQILAIRLDQPNQYKESGGIKNVFQGTSSIVCRYLLHEPGPHETVSSIHDGIHALDGRASLSTVSKVLSTLHDEMIIEKAARIRVLQPRKLLVNLRNEYQPPRTVRSAMLNLPDARQKKEEILSELSGWALWIWSGMSSAERYATTTPSQQDVAYVRELPTASNQLTEYEDERFYNCVLHETPDDMVFVGHQGPYASDVQTYLELMQGDKREREIARQVEHHILTRFESTEAYEEI